jgi:hypothetical protein
VFPKDFYVPVNDDESGIVKVAYKNLYVAKNWATDITEFTNTTPGTIIKIKGDTSLVATKNVVNGAKITLAGGTAFNLKSGGTLTLFVNADGTVKELARTAAPETVIVPDVNFTSAAIDANDGDTFLYTGAASVTVNSILNGVEGKTISIYGTDAAGVDVTVNTVAGVIKMDSAAVLADANDYVQVTLVDGVWIETGRSITA